MENKNVMTCLWSESKSVFTKVLNRGKNANNFNEFIFSYPLPKDRLFSELLRVCENYKINDVTNTTLLTEDCVLFDPTDISCIDIVFSNLNSLNSGGRVKGMWCYVDSDKKAVVHFVNKKGWYAELFIKCNEDFSALHLIKDEDKKVFIPVTFKKDISQEVKMVSLSGGEFLHKYLPRVTLELLGKNSPKNKPGKKFHKTKRNEHTSNNYRDKDDNL